MQINKVIGENEKCAFYFTEKLNGLFGQPNRFLRLLVCGSHQVQSDLLD